MASSPYGHRRGQMVNGVWTLDKEPAIIALSAAAKAANAIVVTGQLKSVLGDNIAEVRNVMLRTLAVTAAKGVMTLSTGTAVVASAAVTRGAAGENDAWVKTDNTGKFVVSIADDQAEAVMLEVSADGCFVEQLALSFV